MVLPLMPFWLKIKIVTGLIPAIHFVFIFISFCVVMVAVAWNGNEDAEVEILIGGWNADWEFP